MGKPVKDIFTPSNPSKYVGQYPIVFRSSWEFAVMSFLDRHPSCQHWGSESISIPYRNPLTGKWTQYLPDFFTVFIDPKTNAYRAEIWEVKPMKEVPGYKPNKGSLSKRDQASQAVNAAKWVAAQAFCARKRMSFRVLTEDDLFTFKKNT